MKISSLFADEVFTDKVYEQKFIMAEIMRMRMFKMLLTSVWVKIQ